MVCTDEIMSPPMKWGDILFLARCPSVHHAFVSALYLLNPWWDLQKNFAQMSSMMRRCAVPMFDQGRFKVKVTM